MNFTARFDYSKWERTTKREGTRLLPSITSGKTSPSSTSQKTLNQLVDSPAEKVNPYRCQSFGKECSILCRHGQPIKLQETATADKKNTKDGTITILKAQIQNTRVSLEETKKRYLKLIAENLKLKDEITSFDLNTGIKARELLLKYEHFKNGLDVIKKIHEKGLTEQEVDLIETEGTIDQSITVLQKEVTKLDVKIKNEKTALSILLNYKEKEYPEKIEQIKFLQYEIQELSKQFELEYKEVLNMTVTEKTCYTSDISLLREDIKALHAEKALDSMHSPTKNLAQKNMLLRQEINFHRDELRKHEDEIQTLKKEIRTLLRDEKQRLTERKHPELFREKCHPDCDLELNISKQKWLPI